MAALKILNEQPNRLVLGKGGGNGLGTLIGIGIFGIVACVGVSSILDQGNGFNPVILVFALVIGLSFLGNLRSLVASTRVVLDSSTGAATRTDSILMVPTRRQEMAFNLIRDVRVTQPRANAAMVLDTFPIWQVELQATDGSALVVNERGLRAEMDALAQKVGALLNRPVRETNVAKTPTPAPTTYTPSAVMGSLYENLMAFAQSAAESSNPTQRTPTISAFPQTSSRPSEFAQRRARRERDERSTAKQPQPNTLTTPPPAVDDTAVLDATINLSPAPVGMDTYNAFSTPPVSYTAPPVLVMPEMPGMLTFAPALVMPSFAPIGISDVGQTPTITQESEYKQLQVQVAPTTPSGQPSDSQMLARSARSMYMTRNLSQAQATYLRALSMNPADGAIQNDLGVVYLEQNKLQDAERAFRRAIALDPSGNVSRYNLGIALSRMGSAPQANEQFRVGLLNASRNEESYFRDAQRGVLRSPILSETV